MKYQGNEKRDPFLDPLLSIPLPPIPTRRMEERVWDQMSTALDGTWEWGRDRGPLGASFPHICKIELL